LSGIKFFPHGEDGFSVNENVNTGRTSEPPTTAYHFSSGSGDRDVIISLAKTNQTTQLIGTHGTGLDTAVVIGSQSSDTSFDFKRNVGAGNTLNLAGGNLLYRVAKDGQLFAPLLQNSATPKLTYFDTSSGRLTYGGGQTLPSETPGTIVYVTGSAPTMGEIPSPGNPGPALYCGQIPIGMSYGIIRVDQYWGNDDNASNTTTNGLKSKYQIPFKTVAAALAIAAAGDTVLVNPGTYTELSGLILPAGIALRGTSTQTTTIQMTGVSAATTLLTMGENTRVEDLTLYLQSPGPFHYDLTGVLFPSGSNTSVTAKIRTCVITVDNSGCEYQGTSNVYGVRASSAGTLGSGSFSFNSLKGSTINVRSNGGGKKRGILVDGPNIVTTRDLNVYVSRPPNPSTDPSGSYVGIETNNDVGQLGSIQLRSTTVGCVTPDISAGHTYTASDILQTTPATITNPTYLASAGIQVGPGTDLVTKSAGNRGFSTYIYPTTIFYGLKGNLDVATTSGYLWPGTQKVSNDFPDTNLVSPAYYRVQQPCLLSGLSAGLNIGAGGTDAVTVLVRYTPISTGIITSTPFTVTMVAGETIKEFYNASVRLNTGDRIHVQLLYTGGNGNEGHDLTVQLDMF
jgi:hypothetical protein